MRTRSASTCDPFASNESPTSVLLVDGDPEGRTLLRRHLFVAGEYQVYEASTVDEAVRLMAKWTPDLIVVDHALGTQNGLAWLHLTETDTEANDTPPWAVLFVSESDPAGIPDAEALFAAGADDLLWRRDLSPRTLRRAALKALARAHVRMVQAERIEELQRRLAFEGRLIGIAGHDLRTPLSALLMSLDALTEHPDVPIIKIAKRSGVRIRDMVTQLLDLTRHRETAAFPLQRSHVDLLPILEQVVQEHRVTSGREVLLEARSELRGSMDVSAIGQLVSNLVANALAYGDRGEPVQVYAEWQHEHLVLRVINQGKSIPALDLERAFGPFVRGEVGDGLGLGLYIVRAIVDSHGGELSANSNHGETEFVARWPCAGGPAREPKSKLEASQTSLAD